MQSSRPASVRSPLEPLDLVSLNTSAIRKQEVDNSLASTSRGLQTLLESSTFFKNLHRIDPSSVDSAGQANRFALATHLNKIVTSESFAESFDDSLYRISSLPHLYTLSLASAFSMVFRVQQTCRQRWTEGENRWAFMMRETGEPW